MLSRRACFLLAAAAGCGRKSKHQAGPVASAHSGAQRGNDGPGAMWHELPLPATAWAGQSQRAVLFDEGRRAPLLLALHGAGEAAKGPLAGARGWRDDYDLDRTLQRLRQPPLLKEDFHGHVGAERLRALNADLNKRPYRGLHIACPYAPRLRDKSFAGVQPYAAFLRQAVLPRLGKHLGARLLAATGIDGVSMGGRMALLIGLGAPEIFSSVAALQPAISMPEVPRLCELARQARTKRPDLYLRLVTSHGDYFRPAVRAFSEGLRSLGIAHDFLLCPGPHDYVFNRGPGGYEMVLYHERALRAEVPV